jgi:hypothetical protein
MIRFVLGWVLSAFIVYFAGSMLPYWGIMGLIFLSAFFVGGNISLSFLSHALGFATAWFLVIQNIIIETESSLPNKIAELMSVKDSQQLIVYTIVLGFILGGVSGLTGSSLKKILNKKSRGYGRPVY